jgi:formylglycine-generating enzyme required for sulfatase activity
MKSTKASRYYRFALSDKCLVSGWVLAFSCLALLVAATICRAEEVVIDDNWKFQVDADSIGIAHGWMQPGFDDAHWESVTAGKAWSAQGYFNYAGVAWYRKRITIEPRFRGKFIIFIAVNDTSTIYFDGSKVASESPSSDPHFRGTYINTPPFRLRLPNAESVLVAIRVAGADWHSFHSPGPGLAGDVKLSNSELMSGYGYWLAPDDFVSRTDWLTALRQQRALRRVQLEHTGRLYEGPFEWDSRNFVQAFVFAYDTRFYDYRENRYKIDELLDDGVRRFGGYDSLIIWDSYPNLGVDEQNQFQMIRDLPGGLPGLRAMVARAHQRGVKVYFAFNPWDRNTKQEGSSPEQSLGAIIRDTNADGMFLDVTDNLPYPKLRNIADGVKPGVAIETEGPCYSDGGIDTVNECWGQFFPVAGLEDHVRGIPIVKWTEPRVMIHYDGDRWRHSRTSMFQHAFLNGTGLLIWEDVFGSWNRYSDRDRAILRRMAPIDRFAADLLTSDAWEPFCPTKLHNVDASYWPGSKRSLWTFVNWGDQRQNGVLLTTPYVAGTRYFDLWNGVQLHPVIHGGIVILSTDLEPRGLGAILAYRGAPDAALQRLLNVLRQQAATPLSSDSDEWASTENPILRVEPKTIPVPITEPPQGMVLVPTVSKYLMSITHNLGEAGCYPDDLAANWSRRQYFMYEANNHQRDIIHEIFVPAIPAFFMDKYPVTNAEFSLFLESSNYHPRDSENFLKDWDWSDVAHPKPPHGFEDHPVVWIDLEDARTFARWAGKRLPTEEEWQYAAGGAGTLRYPWGNTWQSGLANDRGSFTTSVAAFPKGANSFGLEDLSGNVWEWTESERNDGNRYALLRGGSFYQPEGSSWYFDRFTGMGLGQGEWSARPVGYHAKLFLMSPGMDRKATIGFRCVKDVLSSGGA